MGALISEELYQIGQELGTNTGMELCEWMGANKDEEMGAKFSFE